MIEQPKNLNIKSGNTSLDWNKNFAKKWQSKYDNAQKVLDSEVLRLCEPYIPLISGMLIKSGITGTIIGSGLVQWIAVYAKRVYYQKNETIGRDTGPLRGKNWVERMKADKGKLLVQRVKEAFGKDVNL